MKADELLMQLLLQCFHTDHSDAPGLLMWRFQEDTGIATADITLELRLREFLRLRGVTEITTT